MTKDEAPASPKDAALRLALDALTGPGYYDTYQQRHAIAAIKQVMEQPEPEPVALLRSLGPKPWETSEVAHAQVKLILDFEAAYTAPPVAANDTSNNRVDETAKKRHEPVACSDERPCLPCYLDKGDCLATAPEPEPVAWIERIASGVSYDLYHEVARKLPEGFRSELYTSPQRAEGEAPKREPLTDEQKEIFNFLLGASDIDGVWFGDKHPTEKGQLWWRYRLCKAFQEAAHGIFANAQNKEEA